MSKQRQILRNEMRLITANLDERWLKAASVELSIRLCDLFNGTLKSIKHILAFQPINPGAVDLTYFLFNQLELGKRVYIPCGSKKDFSFFEINSELLKEQALVSIKPSYCENILNAPFIEDDSLNTAVILPGLAFDQHGNRVGWGKLHYEHLFRKATMRQALKVGVCWEMQLQSEIPSGTTDLLVDWICHERMTIKTSIESDAQQDFLI
jgi:5-formyltetrahydrofolate cyclo-ligase